MKTCDNCGGEHPSHWWEEVRYLWRSAKDDGLSDARRFAFALAPLYQRVPPLRRWWGRQMMALVMARIEREFAEQDMVIQLERTDPRAAALMMFLHEGQQERSH